jgi:NUDIX domain
MSSRGIKLFLPNGVGIVVLSVTLPALTNIVNGESRLSIRPSDGAIRRSWRRLRVVDCDRPEEVRPKPEPTRLERQVTQSLGQMLADLPFVGKRVDMIEEARQMPQGGIDGDETPIIAAMSELPEELGTANVEIVAESSKWLQYELPSSLQGRAWGGQWRGQRQKWFLMRFLGDDREINIATEHWVFLTSCGSSPLSGVFLNLCDGRNHCGLLALRKHMSILAQGSLKQYGTPMLTRFLLSVSAAYRQFDVPIVTESEEDPHEVRKTP